MPSKKIYDRQNGSVYQRSTSKTFNREEEESKRNEEAKSAWVKEVNMPFLNKKRNGKESLLRLLRSVMGMHRKEDIDLPKLMSYKLRSRSEYRAKSRVKCGKPIRRWIVPSWFPSFKKVY
jgi:hypothetical protein